MDITNEWFQAQSASKGVWTAAVVFCLLAVAMGFVCLVALRFVRRYTDGGRLHIAAAVSLAVLWFAIVLGIPLAMMRDVPTPPDPTSLVTRIETTYGIRNISIGNGTLSVGDYAASWTGKGGVVIAGTAHVSEDHILTLTTADGTMLEPKAGA